MKLCLFCNNSSVNDEWYCSKCHSSPPYLSGFLSFSPDLAKNNEGFKEHYFSKLFDVEKNNFWFCSRNKLILWSLKKYFPFTKTFFEIGCGTGFVSAKIQERVSHLQFYASEIFTEGLMHAQKRIKSAVLLQMDARNIPFSEEFDVIGAFDVLEHIEEDKLVLQQMHKATAVDGGIIITVPQHHFLWSKVDEYACHVRRYGKKELINKIERAGFEIVMTTSFVSLLFPLMFLSRFSQKKKENSFGGEAELRHGYLANQILKCVMTIERALIILGVRFLFGGSLMVIAKKSKHS